MFTIAVRTAFICICLSALFSCQSAIRFASKDTQQQKETISELNNISNLQENIILESEAWIGTPYCYGGSTKECTDCSGFVKNVYDKYGYNLPRTSSDQYKFGDKIGDNNAQAGDLVFFSDNNKITHVGIYLGGNVFIHASSSNGVIKQSLSDSYYVKRFAGFCRVIN